MIGFLRDLGMEKKAIANDRERTKGKRLGKKCYWNCIALLERVPFTRVSKDCYCVR